MAKKKKRNRQAPAPPAEPPSGSSSERQAVLLIAVLALVAYTNSLGNGFVYDARYIIERSALLGQVGAVDWLTLASSPYWGAVIDAGLYRPLTLVSFGAHRALGGTSAFGFHFVDILLHAACAVLVFYFARSLRLGLFPALAAGIAFALHPVQTEAVDSIVGRADILATGFTLASLMVFVSPTRFRLLTSGLLFLLALLAKESAAFALPLFVLMATLFRLERPVRRLAPLVAAGVLYLALRMSALGGMGISGRAIGTLDNTVAASMWTTRLFMAPVLLGKYLLKVVWPWPLSADYSFDQIPIATALGDWRIWVGLFLLGALLWIGIRARRHEPRLSFALGALVLPLGGLLHVLFPLGTVFAERLLYLPMIGASLLIGIAFSRLDARRSVIALATLAAVWSVTTFVRNEDWRDNETLFRRTVETSPRSARAHFLLGAELLELGDFPGAGAAFEAGLATAPGHTGARVSLGQALLQAGNSGSAEAAFEEALRRDPSHPGALYGLGLAYHEEGRLDEALEALEKAAALMPDWDEPRREHQRIALTAGRKLGRGGEILPARELFIRSFELSPSAEAANEIGVTYGMTGELDQAEMWHSRALALSGENALALNYLGLAAERQGRLEEARRLYGRALAADPDLVPAILNAASRALNDGSREDAVALYQRAVELAQDPYEAYNGLGIALAGLGRDAAAADAFRAAIEIHPEIAAAQDNLRSLERKR